MSVLRAYYTGLLSRPIGPWPFILVVSLAASGCSMSVATLESEEAPATTGSIAAPVEVREPLPETLAYSDARKIGEAAVAAIDQAAGGEGADWVNAATGSSGSIAQSVAAEDAASAEGCSRFDTMVTSIGGVHQYSGSICKAEGGGAVVQIEAPEQPNHS